jgi:hypothetical protein
MDAEPRNRDPRFPRLQCFNEGQHGQQQQRDNALLIEGQRDRVDVLGQVLTDEREHRKQQRSQQPYGSAGIRRRILSAWAGDQSHSHNNRRPAGQFHQGRRAPPPQRVQDDGEQRKCRGRQRADGDACHAHGREECDPMQREK